MTEKLNYILYEDPSNPCTYLLGFNKFNTPGCIDERYSWSDKEIKEFQEKVIEKLAEYIETWETDDLSYFVYNIDGLKEKLKEMGITEQAPAWIK